MARSEQRPESSTERVRDILALARKVYGLRGFAGPTNTVLAEAAAADPPLRNAVVLEMPGDVMEEIIILGEVGALLAEKDASKCAPDAAD